MTTQYAVHRFPCLDKYPANQPTSASDKLKASFKVASIWKQPAIKIAFLDGTQKQKDWVQKVITEKIAPICTKLKFIWNVPLEESDIRVSFSLPGQAWSYIGTDALSIPKNEMTLNFGWLDNDEQFDSPLYKGSGQVVLHEFGHALGMIHEHQNPKNNPIVWNRDVIYSALQQSNGWTPQQVDHNMFEKYGDAEMCAKVKQAAAYPEQASDIQGYCNGDLVNGSDYDIHSIMHYFYPASWILSGNTEIPVNTALSDMDKLWLSKYYGDGTTTDSTTSIITTLTALVDDYDTDDDDDIEYVDVQDIVEISPGKLTDNVNTDIEILITVSIILYVTAYCFLEKYY